jgi:hypothetical protein
MILCEEDAKSLVVVVEVVGDIEAFEDVIDSFLIFEAVAFGLSYK